MQTITSSLKLVTPGVLTIGTIEQVKPMAYQDNEGNWKGFEVDILRFIAEHMRLAIQFIPFPFDHIWLRPKQGECDIASAVLTILPERVTEGAAFSRPIFEFGQSLLIRTSDSHYFHTLQDLANKKIGAVKDTMGEAYLREYASNNSQIICYKRTDDVLSALRNHEIDAFARGEPCNGYIARQYVEFDIIDIQPCHEKVGFAVSQENNVLLNIINTELKNMSENSILRKLRKFWKAYNIHLLY
ncbi:ABC transporter substrate-binding protein [Zooshikella harenae]|uniref:Amino acid ABC transporter substrate-binding protein n=1 Tax=Zooshikella harenae TaxID=2827238 RepID=A0ABS5ZI66_9GAMM|nr:ABC transporter substrate-binding protein [Zooshikella harenae]MBU2712966.1 amino acid ABC transporter substrate-binding protein [Zooshikella harenae]